MTYSVYISGFICILVLIPWELTVKEVPFSIRKGHYLVTTASVNLYLDFTSSQVVQMLVNTWGSDT